MANAELRERVRYALASESARDQLMSLLGFTTFGTEYFVDANDGNDNNDGLSPDTAYKTVLKAYNATTSGAHDIIWMSANAGHTFTDMLDVTKSRVHFIGAGVGTRYLGQRTRWTMGVTTGSAIALLKVTGVGCTFTNIKMTSSDTLAASLYCVADGGEFTQFTYCWFEKDTDLNQTTAAELLANGDTSYYKNCTIGNGIYTVTVARQNVLCTRETITGKVARDVIFEDCIFLSRCNSTTFVNVRATTNDLERLVLFKNCHFEAVKTSPSTQDEAFGIASALTDASITLQGGSVTNITNIATVTSGVFTNLPAGAELGGKTIQAS